MNPLIVMSALAIVPLLLILVTRANASVIFLSVCAGSLISKYLSDDIMQLFVSFVPSANDTLQAIMHIVIFLIVPLLTIVFMRGGMPGSKALVNLVPAVATSLVIMLLTVPLLPENALFDVTALSAWSVAERYQSFIVGVAAFTSMVLLWTTQHPSRARKRGRHKKA